MSTSNQRPMTFGEAIRFCCYVFGFFGIFFGALAYSVHSGPGGEHVANSSSHRMTIRHKSATWHLTKPLVDAKIASILCKYGDCKVRSTQDNWWNPTSTSADLSNNAIMKKTSFVEIAVNDDHTIIDSVSTSTGTEEPARINEIVEAITSKILPTVQIPPTKKL